MAVRRSGSWVEGMSPTWNDLIEAGVQRRLERTHHRVRFIRVWSPDPHVRFAVETPEIRQRRSEEKRQRMAELAKVERFLLIKSLAERMAAA